MLHTAKNIRNTFLAVLPTKFVLMLMLMVNLVNQLFFTGEKNAVNWFIKTIFKEYNQKIKKSILIRIYLCL